jgi:hypothetical protein
MSDTNPNPAGSAGEATPPRKRGGFTIFLYIVLVLAIVLCIWALGVKKKFENNPTVKTAIQTYENLIDPMKDKTQAQIEAEGEHIAASDLAAEPETVSGRYVVVDGEVQSEETSMVATNMEIPNMVKENLQGDTKGYILDDGIVLVDISGEGTGQSFKGGEYLRGYGAVLVVSIADVFELPFIGPDLKKDFGDVKDTAEKVVFVFSKGVKQITADEAKQPGAMGAPAGATPSSPTSDGAPPAEGTAPPATPPAGGPPSGETPPAAPPDGETPPATPPGEGETPPATPPGDGGTPPATPPQTPPGG